MSKVVATVLGFDPGFASFGWSVVHLTSDYTLVLDDAGIIRTKKSSTKKEVFAASDNFERAKEIGAALAALMGRAKIGALCAESMSFPRSSSVAAKMAMSWGLVAMIAMQQRLPLVSSSPQRIKKVVCGSIKASKEEVQAKLVAQYPDLLAILASIKAEKQHEHAVDAFASVVAGSESDVIRALWRR